MVSTETPGDTTSQQPFSRTLGAIPGWTFKLKYPHQGESATIFATVNGMRGSPVEVFLSGKGDQDELSALAWTVSKLLQAGYPVQDLADSLWGFRGVGGIFNAEAHRAITCLANVVAFALSAYVERAGWVNCQDAGHAEGQAGKPGHQEVDWSRDGPPLGERQLQETGAKQYEECPKCSQRTLVRESGCSTCYNCGYGKCG